jgi:hypothetical protein
MGAKIRERRDLFHLPLSLSSDEKNEKTRETYDTNKKKGQTENNDGICPFVRHLHLRKQSENAKDADKEQHSATQNTEHFEIGIHNRLSLKVTED